jgi:uncharacterized protein
MSIAIVSGASSGMGRDFVLALDKEYAFDQIWVIARRKERLEALKEQCKTEIVPIALDLMTQDAITTIENLLKEKNANVGALVNASGYGVFKAFEESNRQELEGIIELNDRALVALTHAVLPFMHEGSFIINLGSNSSHQPVPYIATYAASKAFVLSFSLALGVELKKRGIHVLCVCPGWIKTEFFNRAVKDNTTIVYYDRFYESKDVVKRAMKDLKKHKTVSILGLPVRMQVRLVKFLPKSFVMSTWCKQQKK